MTRRKDWKAIAEAACSEAERYRQALDYCANPPVRNDGPGVPFTSQQMAQHILAIHDLHDCRFGWPCEDCCWHTHGRGVCDRNVHGPHRVAVGIEGGTCE